MITTDKNPRVWFDFEHQRSHCFEIQRKGNGLSRAYYPRGSMTGTLKLKNTWDWFHEDFNWCNTGTGWRSTSAFDPDRNWKKRLKNILDELNRRIFIRLSDFRTVRLDRESEFDKKLNENPSISWVYFRQPLMYGPCLAISESHEIIPYFQSQQSGLVVVERLWVNHDGFWSAPEYEYLAREAGGIE